MPNQQEPRPRDSGRVWVLHVNGFGSIRVLHIFGISVLVRFVWFGFGSLPISSFENWRPVMAK